MDHEATPSNTELLTQAKQALRDERWGRVLDLLSRILARDPDLWPTFTVFLVSCFVKLDQPDLALDVTRGARASTPKSARLLATVLAEAGLHDRAQESLDGAGPDSDPELKGQVERRNLEERRLVEERVRRLLGGDIASVTFAGYRGLSLYYRASSRRYGSPVGLKVLRPALVEVPDAVNRFLEEAVLLFHLDHPGLPALHSLVKDDDLVATQGEWLDEGSITGDVTSGVTLDRALALFRSLADILTACHRHGTVLRALDPHLILSPPGLETKVTSLDRALQATRLGRPHEILAMGPLRYTAPEWTTGNLSYPADVYSAGVIVADLLLGAPGGTAGGSPARDMAGTVSRLRHLSVPVSITQILERCLAWEPRDRYPSGAELKSALAGVQDVDPT